MVKSEQKKRKILTPVCWTKKAKRRYRFILSVLLLVSMGAFGICYLRSIDRKIPDHIYLFQNQNAEMNFSVPLEGKCQETKDVIAITNGERAQGKNQSFGLDKPLRVMASKLGSYRAELKLFGIFHYKYIHFDVIEEAKVMPSGKAVGLYIRSKGIMVLGTSQIEGADGFSHEPAKDILQAGDIIKKIEGREVEKIDDAVALIQKKSSRKIKLEIFRGGNIIEVKLEKILAKDGEYKLGVWLREDTEGIGTLTFVTESHQFAALGHGITDIDTGELIQLSDGSVYPAIVEEIRKGEAGNPGELIGSVVIGKANCIGEIQSNTTLGITGNILADGYRYQKKKAVPIGLKQEVKTGKAWILCQLGREVEKYEVKIEKIDVSSTDNKGIVLRITDKELLKCAGGIVQGMSGSPIIQDGKIIGAVTHVLVNDPTRGYGIFIENMLEH